MSRLVRILALAGTLALAGCPEQNVQPGTDAGTTPGTDAAAVATDASTPAAPDTGVVSSHAYKGHENDSDMNAFVNAYPATVGTRLDDCQTCHKSATLTDTSNVDKKVSKTACDFCHLIQHPMTGTYDPAQPTNFAETLNPYGAAYVAAGRTQAALTKIDDMDSDGDTFANGVEIADIKYPGDSASKPGQPVAPLKVFTKAQLQALPAHSEFLLANSTKQQYDYYATYKGVKLTDLLTAVGVDPTDANIIGVTVIAPDGFTSDITKEEMNRLYPKAQFWAGLDTATLGTTCGFVQYPETIPAGLVDGGEIPDDQYLMLAYERDGKPMDACTYDATSGKINGEGPYRLVFPQAKPGKPDRGSQYSPQPTCTNAAGDPDGFDFVSSADHNAGAMTRGVVVVRINPLPAGYEDIDAKNRGWAFVENATVMVYGYGVTQ
ncbi:MAG: hypothetical protein QM765_13115 [Myxococcales bacterium]